MTTTGDLVIDSEFGKVYVDIFNLALDSKPEETAEAEVERNRNYLKLRPTIVGEVFNRRSVFLNIHWGNVEGTRVLRVAITRIGSRGEEDKTLVKFDMPAEPIKPDNHMQDEQELMRYALSNAQEEAHNITTTDNNLLYKHPKEYVFQALKQAKKQFSAKVGCSVCGKPNIWFKKIKTPSRPLYQVMFKELDFANTDNRVCRECEKLVNRRSAEFNPVPELDDDGNKYDSIFADSVSEPYTIRRDLQFDSQDYLAALDVHTSNLQLGG